MVESNTLDNIFMALSDSTRRNILTQVAQAEMSIGEIARHYQMSLAAVSKHIQVLERATLITKRRRGKEQVVVIVPETLGVAREQIEHYATMWQQRFDQLDAVLAGMQTNKEK